MAPDVRRTRFAWLPGAWLAALTCMPALPARAEEHPLWEFGFGAGGLVFNDYRGAATTHVWPVPVPYFVYRGEYLRADRNGVRGRLLERRWFEFEISANATAPVFSSGSAIRRGMPNLEPTLELGPAARLHLLQAADAHWRLDVQIPIREAITVTSPPKAIGLIAAPNLNFDFDGQGMLRGWYFGALGGPIYAQQRYHAYFYGVAPAFATATRPEYEASGGYSGSQLLLAASRRFPRCWIGAYARHDWLAGATFTDSPLVQQRSYWAGGLAFVWMIAASSRQVESPD